MSYTAEGITIVSSRSYDLGRVLVARTEHFDKVVQCYVSGALAGRQRPRGGTVAFVLPEPRPTDVVCLLAVDEADADTNFWSAAMAGLADRGHRIHVETPRTLTGGAPGDVWKVYRGDAGGAEADVPVHQQPYYSGGRGSGGWGAGWGVGGWGFGGADRPGWGNYWGLGEWGFNCDLLAWTGPPLPHGEYPVRVVLEDRCGNVSAAAETSVVLATYPRPASALTVTIYEPGTDTLTLAFAASEDLSP